MNSALAGGTYASKYGFDVSSAGTGVKVYNTGGNGTAIGLSNNTFYTVSELLKAADAAAPLTAAESTALNSIFDGINTSGDII